MQRIIKSAFPCASTYVHTYVCLWVCVCAIYMRFTLQMRYHKASDNDSDNY